MVCVVTVVEKYGGNIDKEASDIKNIDVDSKNI